MYLKSINNLNMKATPMFSDACNNYNSWKSIINESLPDKINENELIISCVQEIYGYRTGVFGYVFNYLSLKCNLKTTFIVDYLNRNYFMNNNLKCWDSLFLSSLFSYINSYIPLLNYGVFDYKNYISNGNIVLKYKNDNKSIRGMFNYSDPYYDSGCCIYSNKKPFMSGYEPLEYVNKISISDKLASKGIVWSFFKEENKGILVITFNLSDDINNLTKILELDQIIRLHNQVKDNLVGLVTEFESFICGDCKFDYKEHCETSYLELLEDFKIINNSTNYIFYKHDNDYLLNVNLTNNNTRVFSGEIYVEKENVEEEINNDVYVEINTENESNEIQTNEIVIKEVDDDEEDLAKEDKTDNKNDGILPFLRLNNYFRSKLSPSSASSSSSNDDWTKI